MQTYTTTKAHERSFDTAPRVRTGDLVRFLRHEPEHPGWFFGRAGDLEGYFPLNWFDLSADESAATARRDYNAAELTIEVGVDVECVETEGAWLLVRTAAGDEGWIPSACVE